MDKKGKVNNNNNKKTTTKNSNNKIKKQTNKQNQNIKKQHNRYPLQNDSSIITTKRTQNCNKPWKTYKTA
jgi:hypothetical protein